MTKKQIYETIVSLTSELTPTKVGTMLFEAAKSEEGGKKVDEIIENFISQYSDLYLKMCNFAAKFTELYEACEDVEVFGPEKDMWKFDTALIDVSSFFALAFLTNINSQDFFAAEDSEDSESNVYLDAIEKESGSTDLAEFLGAALLSTEELDCLEYYGFNYSNTSDLLADIFAGKLKEYIE